MKHIDREHGIDQSHNAGQLAHQDRDDGEPESTVDLLMRSGRSRGCRSAGRVRSRFRLPSAVRAEDCIRREFPAALHAEHRGGSPGSGDRGHGVGGVGEIAEAVSDSMLKMEDPPPQKSPSTMEIQQKIFARFEYFSACS